MVRTRGGTGTGDDASKSAAADKENVKPDSAKKSQDVTNSTKGKRKATEITVPDELKKQKKDTNVKASPKGKKPEIQAKEEPEQKTPKKSASKEKKAKDEEDGDTKETKKQRLTSPELEFDYDRSQLRDPRPTPGRNRRPQYDDIDIPEDLKIDLFKRFYVPKPEKPKGRLNAFQKDELHRQEGLLDPLASFHDLYVCHKKGREGSPSYDKAGFQYDWHKVDKWMQPQAYSKSRMMNSMDRALAKDDRDNTEICKAFFKTDVAPKATAAMDYMDHVKDHISKDLGIPWHQIGPKEAKQWAAKFEKKDYATWWHEPNQEENKRMFKMMGGADLRKHI